MSNRTGATPAQPAGLIRRLAALCYDLLLVAGILMASSFAVITARGGAAVPAGSLAYQLFLFAQPAAFFIFFWWRGGQTLGMRAWRIRVETIAGGPLTPRIALIRFAASLLSLALAGAGMWWVALDPDGRAWHDHLSGTRVVRSSR